MKKLLKSFKTEINPTPEQKIRIHKTIGTCRYVYNFYLGHNKALHDNGEKFMTGKDFSLWLNNKYIPDNPDLYEALTGIQYLSFIADIYKVSKEQREELIKYYGDKFELTKYLGDLISSYSHGMKQKLAVISALIHKPKLLILDEPFVGLDPKASHALKEIMREICNEGSAIFFSTHVLEVAEKLEGTTCGNKMTSCPDQLAKAIAESL